MLDARIYICKLRQFVERFIAIATDQRLQMVLDVDDIDQIAVPVERVPFELHFYYVMV